VSFYIMHYPTCEFCGDVFPYGDTDPICAKMNAAGAGWQAWPTAWLYKGVEVQWDFYCPTHLRDTDE
jgi:hypothetical protein